MAPGDRLVLLFDTREEKTAALPRSQETRRSLKRNYALKSLPLFRARKKNFPVRMNDRMNEYGIVVQTKKSNGGWMGKEMFPHDSVQLCLDLGFFGKGMIVSPELRFGLLCYFRSELSN